MWLFLRIRQNLNHMACSDAIHGWMKSFISSTTSFNICNNSLSFQHQGWGLGEKETKECRLDVQKNWYMDATGIWSKSMSTGVLYMVALRAGNLLGEV
jgi:hypothetical protein